MLRRFQRGDTLIEVLFAVAVFSFIVVGALSLMNQGTAASQRALETTMVRQEVDGQAETLRFLHDAYVEAYQPGVSFNTTDATSSPAEEWYKIVERIKATNATAASTFGTGTTCPTPPSGSFVVNPRTAQLRTTANLFQSPDTWARLIYDQNNQVTASQGIWIEGIRSGVSSDSLQQNVGFIDFHIRACWSASGLTQPMTVGTIVRLYEPRG